MESWRSCVSNLVTVALRLCRRFSLCLADNCPRAASVTAFNDVELFRVDQKTFRFILQDQTKKGSESKIKLLKGIPFLTNLAESDISKLTSVMTPKKFAKGEFLIRKGEAADNFYIIESGTVKARNIQVGDAKYEDIEIGPGGFGGERAIMTGEPRAADLVAVTDGLAFVIDKDTFHAVLGNLQDLITKAQDKQLLVRLFSDCRACRTFLTTPPARYQSFERLRA